MNENESARAESVFLKVGRLFDGVGECIEDGCISIGNDGRIIDIGPNLSPRESSQVLEFPESTMIPGIVDCHVHLTLDGSPNWMQEATASSAELALRAASAARRTLLGGVTTARSLGAPGCIDIAVRDAINRGDIPGPRLLCSGPVICTTGGHGSWMGRIADGADSVRAAVRATLADGADLIKIMVTGGVLTPGSSITATSFTRSEIEACVDEAHRLGVTVVAHALTSDGVESAVRAGCDFIEHGDGLGVELADLMAKEGTYLGATLTSALDFLAHSADARAPQWALDKLKKTAPSRVEAFRIAVQRGVPLVMSTDAGTPFHPHGSNAAEIAAMVEYGLDPLSAIRVATSGGAEALGLIGEVGTLAVGKIADIIVIAGDVVADPELFRSGNAPEVVMKGGVIYRERDVDNRIRVLPVG